MAELETSGRTRRSLRRHGIVGVAVGAIGLGGLAMWAATAEMADAVVAGGTVVVDDRSPYGGGAISEVLAETQDAVEPVRPLTPMDGASLEASLTILVSQIDYAMARKSRLEAERFGDPMKRPTAPGWIPGESFENALEDERRLMQARRRLLDDQLARLDTQKAQLDAQVGGRLVQQAALRRQLATFEEEWLGLEAGINKGPSTPVDPFANRIARAGIEGEIARLEAEIAGARSAIAELDLAGLRRRHDLQSQAVQELQEVNATVAHLLQQRIALADRMVSVDIGAPQAGVKAEMS